MQIKKIQVSDLLNSNYEVPPFQRHYEWSKEACETLFDQILEAFQREEEIYFLGSVIIHDDKKNSKKEIIDGQQRMTSLLLLIKALWLHHPDLSELKKRLYLADRSTGEIFDECRIVSHVLSKSNEESDKEEFAKILKVSDHGALRSEPRRKSKNHPPLNPFERNLKVFSDKFVEWKEEFHVGKEEEKIAEEMKKFSDYLQEKVYFAYIELDNMDNALRMFNTLNTSGKPLGDQDIIKSTLCFKLGNNQEAVNNLLDYWSGKEGNALGDYLSSYSHIFQYSSKNDLVSLRKFFLDEIEQKDPEEIIKNIKKIAFITDEFICGDAELSHWIWALQIFWFSRLCCIAYIFKNSDFSEDENSLSLCNGVTIESIIDLIQNTARFVWRRRAAYYRDNVIQRDLAKVVGELMRGESPDWSDEIKGNAASLKEYLESHELSKRNRQKDILILYNILNPAQQEKDHLISAWFFWGCEVEHILPQKHEYWNSWGEN